MNWDLFTLGETMLRMAAPGHQRLDQVDALDVTVGGAESNVAANLARLGKRTAWFSRLTDNPLGHLITQELRAHGVDTSLVQFTPNDRVGLYFVEYGSAPRGIRVVYDRANSAASKMQPADVPVDAIARSKWLHLTGITPALSDSCAAAARYALDAALKAGIPVSFDVNYRALLWTPEQAAAALAPFCEAAGVVFVALRDAVNLFGAPDDIDSALRTLQSRWGGTVIMTQGESGAAGFRGGEVVRVPAVPVEIVDRIGAGDALVSGVLLRLLDGAPLDDALRAGAAMSALKLSLHGDITRTTRAELEALIQAGTAKLHR